MNENLVKSTYEHYSNIDKDNIDTNKRDNNIKKGTNNKDDNIVISSEVK